MIKTGKMDVKGSVISVVTNKNEDYVSLTDMAKFKNEESTGLVISHWLSTRFAIEFLGIWEQINNPDFNVTEFSNIRMNAGSNGYVLSAKQWRDANPELNGNLRDYATINQLICLSNMENLNAVFINDKIPQSERLERLNKIAIQQMEVLENIKNKINKQTDLFVPNETHR